MKRWLPPVCGVLLLFGALSPVRGNEAAPPRAAEPKSAKLVVVVDERVKEPRLVGKDSGGVGGKGRRDKAAGQQGQGEGRGRAGAEAEGRIARDAAPNRHSGDAVMKRWLTPLLGMLFLFGALAPVWGNAAP